MYKGECEICGIKVSPINKKYCSWECLEKNYDVTEKGCWEWKGSLTHYGYPQVNRNGKVHLLHRVFFEKFRRKVPKNLCVLHMCDNRCCINPLHLFLGTKKDNTQDMIKKGRCGSLKGEKSGKSKLTEEQVREIRKLRDTGYSFHKLSKIFEITSQAIWAICVRKNWKHVI